MHASSHSSALTAAAASPSRLSVIGRLNGPWHKPALIGFMAIVIAHWGEHVFQAYQVYVLNWPRPHAMGMLGLAWPWLTTSEWLHYGYALIMLVALWTLLPGFVGRSRNWWLAALIIQFWHHIEHALLLYQAQTRHFLFGGTVPTSIIQIWFPRLELHLFYNTLVFVPMVVAMYYHLVPPAADRAVMRCTCALHLKAAA
jgi:hypothetical protein